MDQWNLLRKWGRRLACVGILLLLALGCKTPPPNLKPAIGPQALNLPPHEPRFDEVGKWPDVALQDPPKKFGPKDKDDGFKNAAASGFGGMNQGGVGQAGFNR
jgi:hypothetical protein